MTEEQKLERCVSLILRTYPQHDELVKYLEDLKAKAEATKELQEENKNIQQSCENYYNEMRSYKNKVEDLEKQLTKAKEIIIECLPKLKRGNWWSLYYKAETFLNKE